MNFNPLTDSAEVNRADFWNEYSADFSSIAQAPSSLSLLRGNIRLCNQYLKSAKPSGRLLKLDLWDEAHHTATVSHIYKNYEEVWALDLSPHVVAMARERLKNLGVPINISTGDMRAMPYTDAYFDYVFTMGDIEHIPKPIEAMKEIYRVLKPGGKAVIGVPNKFEWFGKSIALNILADLGIKKDGREHSFGWKQLAGQLEQCGFKVIRRDGPYFMPWFIRAADWFCAQNEPRAGRLLVPVIKLCDQMSKSGFLLNHGGLLAAVVEKPRIDRTVAAGLAQKFGTPLFVTDKKSLLKNIDQFRQGFAGYKGNFTLCYSVKTNSQLAILKTMKDQGVVAEICSRLDMTSAFKAGFSGDKMIYDGLVKSDEELSLAVANDIQIINIESYDEAVRLEQIARQQNKVVAVGLRLAFPSKTGIKSLLGVTYDRFGSSVRNGEAERVAKFIIKSSHLKLIGLHCHTGSNQLTAKKYLVGVDLAVDFMKLLNDRYGVKITILNLGGGIGIKNIVFYTMIDLLKNFIRNALKQPIIYKFKESFNFGELCQAIVDRLHFKLDQQSLPHPTLHMEPGRALVGNTTDLLLSIINTKRTEVADWIIVDGGTNLLPVLTLFSEYHRIDVYPRQAEAKFKKTSLAGPLLYSADILASNRLLPEAETGDLALIRDVGAYCVVQSNQFLYPRAATIFVEDEEAYIVQRRETVEDILVRDII